MTMNCKTVKWALFVLLVAVTSLSYSQANKPAVIQGKVHVKFKEAMTSTLSSMRVSKVNGLAKTGMSKFDAVASK